MKASLMLVICLLLSYAFSHGQQAFIKHVPDYTQPPATTLPSTMNNTNYCAPFAFLNIVEYWDSVMVHPYARGTMGGLSAGAAAEHIGWFMDTNNQGSPYRANGTALTGTNGTYCLDQGTGAQEFIRFDALNTFGFPYTVPPDKNGYGWDIQTHYVPDYQAYKTEIESGYPVKLDFLFWNIIPTGLFIFNTEFAEDTVYFFDWRQIVIGSGTVDEADPPEQWNLTEGEAGIGHTVTAVGYMESYEPNQMRSTLQTDYAIVHDNWRNTPKNIAIPWQYVSAWLSIRLPEPPDLALDTIRTAVAPSPVYTDSLRIARPVNVCATVLNNGPGIASSYRVSCIVLDVQGVHVAADTIYVPLPLDPGISNEVCFDSLFIPLETGPYTMTCRVFWDQNDDGQINDPDDDDPLNDMTTIQRSAYLNIISQPFTIIPGVPDVNQPPTVTLGSTIPQNFCAPMAAVNITTFWDVVAGHGNAAGVNAGFPPEEAAEYIGWFMDTNDQGNPLANNGTAIYPSANGTYTVDQDSFIRDYIRSDAAHPYPGAPLPASKMGYDWRYSSDYSTGISFYQNEIDQGFPAKIDFSHWNIYYTDTMLFDPPEEDTLYLYNWGSAVTNSQTENEENPWEEWNLEEGRSNIGHAVTGVGYFVYSKTNTFHAIVHDNWPTTHKHIAIPWNNWVATLGMNPLTGSVIYEEHPVACEFALEQNYPNPFNQKTVIRYKIPVESGKPALSKSPSGTPSARRGGAEGYIVESRVELSIYNCIGQKVATLVSEPQSAGSYQVQWDATGFPSGVYYCRLSTDHGYTQTRKLVLMR